MRSQRNRTARRPWFLMGLFASLAALLIAHDIDHIVHEGQIGELSTAFYVFFVLQVLTYVAVLVLFVRERAFAATAAAAVSVLALIALIGAHLTPFGPLPYADADPAPISWVLLFVPIAFAFLTLLKAAGSRR